MAVDNINLWPVNEKGEIVATQGSGTSNVAGYVDITQIPVSTEGANKVVFAPGFGAAPLDADTSQTVFLGSSTLANSSEVNSNNGIYRRALTAKGPMVWLNAMLGRRFVLSKNLAVGGYSTANALATVPDAIATKASLAVYHCGTNGIFMNSNSAQAEFTNAKAAVEQLLDAGMRVIVVGPQKWTSSDPTYSATKAKEYFKYLELLRGLGSSRTNAMFSNWNAPILDTATGDALANAYVDTKHFSNRGAYLVAQAVKNDVDLFTRFMLPKDRDALNLLDDTSMTVTKAATAPVTGTLWSGFTVVRQAGSPTVACSIVPAPDGRGFAQRVQITATAANDRVNVSLNTGTILPLISTGDKVSFEMNVRVVAGHTSVRAIPLYIARTIGATPTVNIIDLGRDLDTVANDKALPGDQIDLLLGTPTWEVESGVTNVDGAFSVLFNGAGSADILLWAPGLFVQPNRPVFYA